jgi:hypothetical protein
VERRSVEVRQDGDVFFLDRGVTQDPIHSNVVIGGGEKPQKGRALSRERKPLPRLNNTL